MAITPPNLSSLLGPILPALPSATVSTEPAVGILPLLSPILRQRTQLLSAASTEPYLRLLCYDPAKAVTLAQIVRSGRLEPHPVSGEVEIDWTCDAETRFRRLDRETLQALTVLSGPGLAFQLVYCSGDGADGWRVGEVTVADAPSPFAQFGGCVSIPEAESRFATSRSPAAPSVPSNIADDDDDDGYWDRYDGTPARTPANQSVPPAPARTENRRGTSDADDDEYFAQYDQVQPAMDGHDPAEEQAQMVAHVQPPLGLGRGNGSGIPLHPGLDLGLDAGSNGSHAGWTLAELDTASPGLVHPRPESSASSNGAHTVAKLEAEADQRGQSEFGIKQHVSRSIRSLYMLSQAAGIDRHEFERIVKTELDMLGMMGD